MTTSGEPIPGSVSRHIQALRAGDDEAASQLWFKCARLLHWQARRLLEGRNTQVADEEDVALVVFYEVCRGLESGQYDRIQDRHDLWRLLWTITRRRVLNHHRRFESTRRLPESGTPGPESALDDLADASVSDQQVVEWMDELQQSLKTPRLQEIAQLLIEGHSDEYIAGKTTLSLRTIQRKVKAIEETWKSLLKSGQDQA